MATHGEQIRDRRWQMKRLSILNRDGFKCTNPNCKSHENTSLDVHHLDYIPGILLWDYPDDMLTTLCHPCHQKEQERPKEERYLINALKMKGFLTTDILSFSCKIETDTRFTNSLLMIIRNTNI
jgi:5-methylcytosine-specific restriction endonuclease McrA